MKTNEIRQSFLDYFAKNNHEIIASSSLVPHNDPSLMFANAGMNQFKNYFTGIEVSKFKRVATAQKCVRAGGKHNDLDNVGFTARHHTFFEMLGNFSFGDYFKEEAIFYAWEFLTKELGINKSKLLATIYHNDDEAYNFWKKIAGLSDDKIIRISTDDNFWSMGETGPCGPCSEIFYEIWNLVFMQFEKSADGEKKPLPKPCIDTGMGLERIASVIQGKNDNYEIDLFKNITDQIEKML